MSQQSEKKLENTLIDLLNETKNKKIFLNIKCFLRFLEIFKELKPAKSYTIYEFPFLLNLAEKNKKIDNYKKQVFKDADLPLLSIWCQKEYNKERIKNLILESIMR